MVIFIALEVAVQQKEKKPKGRPRQSLNWAETEKKGRKTPFLCARERKGGEGMAQLLFLRFVQTSSGETLFSKKKWFIFYTSKKGKPSLFKRLRGQTDRVSILSLPKPLFTFASFFEDQQETQEKEFQKCFLSSFPSGITLS